MHEAEKSDLAIVAVKPANTSGQPGVERVERRAGAEGNVEQQGRIDGIISGRHSGSNKRITVSSVASGSRFLAKVRSAASISPAMRARLM